MKKNIKKQLIKALKSGEYKKTQGALVRNEGTSQATHCCIGVLCDIYRKKILRKSLKKCSSVFREDFTTYGDAPSYVKEWAGLEDGEQRVLVIANDELFSKHDNYVGVLNILEEK